MDEKKKEGVASVDPLDALKGFAGTTSKVVQRAASILEEEVAAGILAAKQIESRFINVKELRAEDPDALLSRFRKDSHEVVDVLLDMVGMAAKYAAKLPQKALSIRPLTDRKAGATASKKEAAADSDLPVMELPDPVVPGGSVEMSFVLANSSATETERFRIVVTDLISAEGERLTDRNVRFTPDTVEIAPDATAKVTLTVSAAKSQKPGLYSGLIQATGKDLRAVLAVRVQEA
jgi:hypothetical protein